MGRLGHIDIGAFPHAAPSPGTLALYAVLIAGTALLPGCSKDAGMPLSESAGTELCVNADVAGEGFSGEGSGEGFSGEGTRAVVTGTTMAVNGKGYTYGLIVCKHEDSPSVYDPYDSEDAGVYGNIQAWYGNYKNLTRWWYSYERAPSSRFYPMYIFTEHPSVSMDVYAYSPWKSGVTVQSGYQYDLSNLATGDIPDLMYATYEDSSSNPTNRNLDFSTPTHNLSLHFHHALARIAVHFKLANANYTTTDGYHALRLYQISLKHKDLADTPLYTIGNMNLLTGALTHLQTYSEKEQKVTFATGSNINRIDDYDIYQDDAWRTYDMLVHPTTYQTDGDFSLEFHFNGTDLAQNFIQTYAIRRSDLLHSDGVTYGFEPGYCYHFYFIIDNYIHLSDVVVAEWTDDNQEEIMI